MNKQYFTELYKSKADELEKYLEDIKIIVIDSEEFLEGNAFYYHKTLNRFDDLFNKQVNLLWCGAIAEKRICEIGFNAGHSALLMLLESKVSEFTVFDTFEHRYTEPAVQYIASKFPNVKFECIKGDSTVQMPLWVEKNQHLWEQYDVVHIDGCHSEHCVVSDAANAAKLVKVGGIIIFDDVCDVAINRTVDSCLESGKFEELDILPTLGYRHRMIRRICRSSTKAGAILL